MESEQNNPIREEDYYDRLAELFEVARKFAPEARQAFLLKACTEDEAMRLEIESLCASSGSESEEHFLETSAAGLAARYLAEQMQHDWVGTKIGRYSILKLLGEGGMGKVYFSLDEELRRPVAIKFLPDAFTASEDRVRRFEQEARAASALNHPNIVTMHEIGHPPDGNQQVRFIVMEFIEGKTLREVLKEKRPDLPTAISLAEQIASALGAAHKASIIHRDIKPENIMVTVDDLVKVLDFGIAKLNEETMIASLAGSSLSSSEKNRRELALPSLTLPGVVAGTASYMSPEQVRGETLDLRSDLFSFGLILYELVTGKCLFAGATHATRLKSAQSKQEPLSAETKLGDVPKELEHIVRKLLRASREERYESASEVVAALQQVKRKHERKASRRLAIWGGLALLGAMLLSVIAMRLAVRDEWEEKIFRDGHAGAIRQFAISPDGKKLVSVGNDTKVIVWDFLRRERLATLSDHSNKVSAVAFSPDSKQFTTASSDGKVIVWDTDTLKKVQVLPGQKRGTSSLSFTPDGRVFIAPSDEDRDGALTLWDTERWQKISAFEPQEFFLVTPNGRWLITQDWDTFDLTTGDKFKAQGKYVWGTGAISPDAKRIATLDSGGFFAIWDITSLWKTKEPMLVSRIQAHRERGRAVAYSPNGRFIASGGEDIILWDANTLEKIARFEYPDRVSCLAFSPDGQSLVSSYGDGNIIIWDVAEKEARTCLSGHCTSVRAVKFSPDGKQLASVGDDRAVIVWETTSGKKQAVFSEHQTRVSDVAFSSDAQWLISSDLGAKTIIREISTGKSLLSFNTDEKNDDKFGYCVAISPDKKWIVTGFGVHRTTDGRMVADFNINNGPSEVYDAAFSPDGRLLACVNPTGRIFLWDVGTWKMVEMVRRLNTYLISMDFSPDGQWIVTGEDDGFVRLWQVRPLREVAVLGRHTSFVRSVAFSPDGQQVASGSDDKTIALWDVPKRKLIGNVGLHTSPVLSVAFSPDGKQLVAGEQDKTIRLYTHHRTLWGRQLN